MSYILNIETATKNCSVSLALNGETVKLIELSEEQFNHAEKLHVFIKEVLNIQGIGFCDLKAIAVSKGPGSYTGLRIGVSAAKGFCYALNIPLIAIDTLEIIAHQLKNIPADDLVIPMIDARRMEVFTQNYSAELKSLNDAYALVVEENSFNGFNSVLHLCGDGALKLKEVLTNNDKFVYHDDIVFPSAAQMSSISYRKFIANDFVDVAYFEPYYLKDFMLTTKKNKDS